MKHLTEPPDLERLPPRLRPIVAKALAKDPARRYSSLKEFESDFNDAVLGKGPMPAPAAAPPHEQAEGAVPPSAPRETSPIRSQEKRAQIRAAVIAAAVAVLVQYIFTRRVTLVELLFVSSAVAVLAYHWNSLPFWRREARDASRRVPHKPRATRIAPPPPPLPPPAPRPARSQLASYWLGGACLAVPLTALLTAGLAFLEPSLFANSLGMPQLDPGAIGLFAVTAVGAVWGAMLVPVMARLRGHQPTIHSRPIALLIGMLVGQLAWATDSFLLVDMPTSAHTLRAAVFTMIGERPLLLENKGPTWLGYSVFFMTLFTLRNWSKMSDLSRSARFSIWSVLLTVGVAYAVALVFAFPPEWALAWGVIVPCVTQMVSPWSPEPVRSRRLRV